MIVEDFETRTREGGSAAIRDASRFFSGMDPVFDTLREAAGRLDRLGIPYAVAGGMALVAHGYRRTTEDVDILVTEQGLKALHEALVGLGYRPIVEGGRHLRDTRTGVRIDFMLTGHFPGDGRPKPVAFPDPDAASVEIDGIRYLTLESLVQLKLASGLTNPGRIRDLGDVQELIRVLGLPDDLAERLDPFVRVEYLRLAAGVRRARESP